MRITDELREWMAGFEVVRPRGNGKPAMFDQLYVIADRIDQAHEQALNNAYVDIMDTNGWIRLPRDADGEVIHVGDDMERMERRGEVVALQLSDNPWGEGDHWAIQLEGEQAPTVLDAFFHHCHAPTIEDVLADYRGAAVDIHREYLSTGMTFEECLDAFGRLDAEYAERIRKAGGA